MLRRSTRVSGRMGRMALAVLAAAALGVVTLPAVAGSAAAAGETGPVLLGSTPVSAAAGSGVSTAAADPTLAPEPTSQSRSQPALSLRVKDPAAASLARRNSTSDGRTSTEVAPDEGGGYFCTESIDTFTGSLGEDDFLEETVRVDYFAHLECNFYLASIEGIAGVLDRSDSFNGESFDGRVLGTGTYVYTEWDYQADSFGAISVRAHDYNGGRRIEAAFELYLLAPEGIIWDACNPIPGLRYLACDGLGTDYLHVVLGTGPFGTGLTKACRDQRSSLDAEQARLLVPAGSTPASTQILRRVTAVKTEVTSFKKALCAITSAAAADPFADQRGLQLWNVAVASAKANQAAGDDRPLYWARLSMTAALRQWRPTFGVNSTALQTRLDKAARGMTSDSFSTGSAKKVFVSGFDPFGLNSVIFDGNPSGAAVLQLDGTTDGSGREIQAVVFPVRYADFTAGMVEDVFRPHLQPGGQQASLVTTVSLGGGQFDLEVYNGRRRSGGTDNLNQTGGGTFQSPVVPPGMGPGSEFVATTLPVHKMQVGSPYSVVIDTGVYEQSPPGSPSTFRPDGPTPGSIAVEGSGSGFLSNEIAYRVTRLRDELGVSVAAGHVHTPTPTTPSGANDGAFDNSRNNIVAQFRTILSRANPIDSPRFFVRQHYLDFLNREPDTGGLDFWTGQITQCGFRDAACIERKQVDVSLAFWYSTDFLAQHPGLRNPPGTSPDFNNAEFIRQAYLVYLRRPADQPGFEFWLGQLNSDNDYGHIAKAFLLSGDYRARFGPA